MPCGQALQQLQHPLHQFCLYCAGLVVAQSYKTRTGSGLKGTGTGADPDEVQQKSQEFLNDLRVILESLPHPFFLSSPHTALTAAPYLIILDMAQGYRF